MPSVSADEFQSKEERLTPPERLVAMLALGQIMDIGMQVTGIGNLLSRLASSSWQSLTTFSDQDGLNDEEAATDLYLDLCEEKILGDVTKKDKSGGKVSDPELEAYFRNLQPVDMFIVNKSSIHGKSNEMIPLKPIFDLQKLVDIIKKEYR